MGDQPALRIPCDRLDRFLYGLFIAAGVPEDDATTIATFIIAQEIRGNTTHGINAAGQFLSGLATGRMKPKPNQPLLTDQGATAVIDGDHGIGIVGCMKGMRLAIKKAEVGGIGMVIVVRNNHLLATAPYCLEAVRAGMIGIVFSNSKVVMGYPGTGVRSIGNEPVGFGVPTADGYPVLFDSYLTTSTGRLRQWSRTGQRIPDWLKGLDRDGRPTTDPQAVLDGGMPLPIGGHKGAGLAIAVEVLTGVLGGAAFLSQITPRGRKDTAAKSDAPSHCCLAINIDAFMPLAQFGLRMADFIADLKDNPLSEGTGQIWLPGEKMDRTKRECEANGIPLETEVQEHLAQWARRLGVRDDCLS